jgi:cytochrome c peroxidase
MRDLSVTENTYNTSAVSYNIRSVFDPHAYNSYFFLPGKRNVSHEKVADLGRTLFFDPALSANNLRACASCHQPGKAFTDGLPLSQSFEPGRMLTRNAPTVINAVLQRKLFHDGRSFSFEDQAGQVMSNPLEMHNDFSAVAVKLRNSNEYVEWFRSAFEGTEDTIITNRSVLTALAEYERGLVGMNSRFDRTVSGRANELNEDEKAGFNLYMGKGNCASCHFIPLFNGTMPPEYVETEWEIIGVPGKIKNGKRTLDEDRGRANIIDVPIFEHAFKTPTLRNIALTGPYMHNGIFRTLEEVIEFYDTGGGEGLGYSVPFQTLSSDSLHLTSTEKFQLIEFLKALTDTVTLTKTPTRLPVFANDEKLNARPIGGDY